MKKKQQALTSVISFVSRAMFVVSRPWHLSSQVKVASRPLHLSCQLKAGLFISHASCQQALAYGMSVVSRLCSWGGLASVSDDRVKDISSGHVEVVTTR